MKNWSYLFMSALIALFSPVRAFNSLPLATTQSLVVTNRNAPQRQSPAPLSPTSRGEPLQSSAVPSFSNETAAFPAPGSSRRALSAERKAQLTLLFRSSFCAMSSIATWAMVKHAGMTIVQASALQGLLGCLALPEPYALAYFCGTFAGMSAQPAALDEASLLALACTGAFYLFEEKKLALGRGGRLGLIAFLSNLVYHVMRKGPQQTAGFVVDIVNQIRPDTAVGVAFLGALLTGIRLRGTKLFGVEESPPMNQRVVKLGAQSAMLALLLSRLSNMGVSGLSVLANFSATFASSLLAWKSKYTIFPVALLGALAGFLTPSLAPAVYMGGFIGMCSLAHFRTSKFFRAAALSSVLLKLGLFAGFGGRLGFLAYVGVNFAI